MQNILEHGRFVKRWARITMIRKEAFILWRQRQMRSKLISQVVLYRLVQPRRRRYSR